MASRLTVAVRSRPAARRVPASRRTRLARERRVAAEPVEGGADAQRQAEHERIRRRNLDRRAQPGRPVEGDAGRAPAAEGVAQLDAPAADDLPRLPARRRQVAEDGVEHARRGLHDGHAQHDAAVGVEHALGLADGRRRGRSARGRGGRPRRRPRPGPSPGGDARHARGEGARRPPRAGQLDARDDARRALEHVDRDLHRRPRRPAGRAARAASGGSPTRPRAA